MSKVSALVLVGVLAVAGGMGCTARRGPTKAVARSGEGGGPVTEAARAAHADDVFNSEAIDPAWAAATAEHLRATVAGVAAPQMRLVGVQCRSKLCRLLLQCDDVGCGRNMVTLVRALRWAGSGMVVQSDPGRASPRTVTLYLARDDTPLPESPSP